MQTIVCSVVVRVQLIIAIMKNSSPNIAEHAVAKVVREARIAAGLSQEALAEAAGLHRTYISLLERTQRSPTVSTLSAIGHALGFEPSKIYRLIAEAVERAESAPPSSLTPTRPLESNNAYE